MRTPIPFNGGPVEQVFEPFDPTRHVVFDEGVADVVHRFMRPNGVPLDFLILGAGSR